MFGVRESTALHSTGSRRSEHVLLMSGCGDVQATGYCKTWAGEGGADAGTVQAATDLEFYIDLDPATGQETVVVAEVKPVRRQARALIRQPEFLPQVYEVH